MQSTALVIQPLDYLADQINRAHQMVGGAVKNLLSVYAIAGHALLEAKTHFKSDTAFGQWRQQHTVVSQPQAWRYMQVAKKWDGHSSPNDLADMTIEQFIGEKTKAERTKPATPTFTKDDAEYALKIEARTRSGFEGEAEVARSKLEGLDVEKVSMSRVSTCETDDTVATRRNHGNY